MAEKRSIPAALGIFIGPAIAYLSYLVFKSSTSEFAQLLCFGAFILAGYELARSRISLSGLLSILFVPALPLAMYLNLTELTPGHRLTPIVVITLWVGSALLGAVIAGSRRHAGGPSIVRLVALAGALSIALIASIWWPA